MLKVFPIRSRRSSGTFTGGSGFLANYSDRLWLITAAHVALAENNVHDRWEDWPDDIAVYIGQGLTFNLFDNHRQPLFAYRAESGRMADILALEVPFSTDDLILKDLHLFDLLSLGELKIGDKITALGYPVEQENWPNSGSVAREFEIVQLSAGVIEHRLSAGKGMSGGPVVDHKLALAGLVMGHNYGIGRVASVEAIRWVIDSCLPHMPQQAWRTEQF